MWGYRDSKRVSDAVLEKEKNKALSQVFQPRFSWPDMIDAIADVYLGVRVSLRSKGQLLTQPAVHLLEYPHIAGRDSLVFPIMAHGYLWI